MLPLMSKEDVGRHAEDVLRKTKTENERKARCMYIAQLYYDVGEYEQVISYIKEYLSLKNSSVAYKLLGQAYEALNQKDNALIAYEKCFKFDENQEVLLLKICELYCDPNILLDRTKAKLALEKTQKYFPYHSYIDKLRERIVEDSSSLDKDEFENLLASEIKKNPEDYLTGANERIKSLSSDNRSQETAVQHGEISIEYQEVINQLKVQSLEETVKLLTERFDNLYNRMDKMECNMKSLRILRRLLYFLIHIIKDT